MEERIFRNIDIYLKNISIVGIFDKPKYAKIHRVWDLMHKLPDLDKTSIYMKILMYNKSVLYFYKEEFAEQLRIINIDDFSFVKKLFDTAEPLPW